MKAYIYHITNKINGKKYIGKTINLAHRIDTHWSSLKNQKHHSAKLQRAVNKYGIHNFILTYQEVEVNDEFELNLLEMKEIQKFDSFTNGYNMTFGGEGNNTVFDFNTSVIIYNILKEYSGVNRKIAKYFKCDHTVINKLAKNKIYENIEYDIDKKNELISQIGLSNNELVENYIKHNERKLQKENCFEILSIILTEKGYDKILSQIFNVHPKTMWRLRNNIIYTDFIKEYNLLSEAEKIKLKTTVKKKYKLDEMMAIRQRRNIKNALTQEQVNYILDNRDIKKRIVIAKELGISADRVGQVALEKSYKDLIANYYSSKN